MPPRPRRIRRHPTAAGAGWRPAGAIALAGPTPAGAPPDDPDVHEVNEASARLTRSAQASAIVADAALRHAVRALTAPDNGDAPAAARHARRSTALTTAERDGWARRGPAREQVADAAGAYARALCRDGAALPAALAAVRALMGWEAAGRLPPAAYAAVQRDAARCCAAAFAAH